MEEWIAIREWARQGLALGEIVRRSGRDPKTVRKVLAEAAPKRRTSTWNPEQSKLWPYREYLLQRVDQGCLNASVLLEEITAHGYVGKQTLLGDFLRPIRQEQRRQREATIRYETGPGKQAQVDWGSFGRIWEPKRERWEKVYGFVFTLGYSRAQHLEFSTELSEEHFLACHLGALGALGIPEQVLYDNLKTAVIDRRPDGSPVFQGRFLDFALYYGFTPKLCHPYRPQTKGKVERGIRYVRQNFWVRVGAEVAAGELDLAGLNERAAAWSEGVANRRLHGTTGVRVDVRLAEEQAALARLDARPRYDTAYQSLRRVSRDGRLSYRGRLYEVPLRYALQELTVREELAGAIRFRERSGQAVPFVIVLDAGRTGGAAAGERSADAGAAADDAKEKARLPEGVDAPVVQTRELSVYEEVADAARAG
ncbi:MAG: IS21 family transposase [Dehalococcoidia bacterium]